MNISITSKLNVNTVLCTLRVTTEAQYDNPWSPLVGAEARSTDNIHLMLNKKAEMSCYCNVFLSGQYELWCTTVSCTFSYHTWQFIIFTIFTITTCIFSYSLSLSFWTHDLAIQQIVSSTDLFLYYQTDYTDSRTNMVFLLCSTAGFVYVVC